MISHKQRSVLGPSSEPLENWIPRIENGEFAFLFVITQQTRDHCLSIYSTTVLCNNMPTSWLASLRFPIRNTGVVVVLFSMPLFGGERHLNRVYPKRYPGFYQVFDWNDEAPVSVVFFFLLDDDDSKFWSANARYFALCVSHVLFSFAFARYFTFLTLQNKLILR
jgi:hypothetical protein